MTLLEDLRNVPSGLLDAGAAGGSSELLRTAVVDEASLRKNLLPETPIAWPPVKDGPLEGIVTTRIAVDRSGTVREVGTIVSANPLISDTARQYVQTIRFKPYLLNGEPVQTVSLFTIPFKTTRLAGTDEVR